MTPSAAPPTAHLKAPNTDDALKAIKATMEAKLKALEAGKHVYSEKPFTTDLEKAKILTGIAESKGLRISCAPSNALSPAVQTLWKIVDDGVTR